LRRRRALFGIRVPWRRLAREPGGRPFDIIAGALDLIWDFDSYPLKMGLKAALCRGKTWNRPFL